MRMLLHRCSSRCLTTCIHPRRCTTSTKSTPIPSLLAHPCTITHPNKSHQSHKQQSKLLLFGALSCIDIISRPVGWCFWLLLQISMFISVLWEKVLHFLYHPTLMLYFVPTDDKGHSLFTIHTYCMSETIIAQKGNGILVVDSIRFNLLSPIAVTA